jgi:hypothetical protein
MERCAARAGVGVHYSQGFNPRPVLSLASPRPVGLAGLDELLVISLDEPIAPDELLQKLNAAAPSGCRFISAEQRPGKAAPQPRQIQMEMSVAAVVRGTGVPPVSFSDNRGREHAQQTHGQDAHATEGLAARLAQLADMPQWPLQRESWKGGQSAKGQTLDLRPMVQFELAGGKLKITLTSSGSQWARPSEVMRLLGLDERADLARICRTKIEYEYPCAPVKAADSAAHDGCASDTTTTASDGCDTDKSQQESGLAPTEAAHGPTGM